LRPGVFLTLVDTKPRDAEARRLINEHKTIASIDKQVDAWHEAQPKPPQPIIVEHPIDNTLQTGESRLLGGAMEIKAPWKRD
jgi:hypothetical protein